MNDDATPTIAKLEAIARERGGELRVIGGWPFVRSKDASGGVVLTTVDGNDAVRELRGPVEHDAIIDIARLLDGTTPIDAAAIAWLAAAFGGWELLGDDVYDVYDWLAPTGGTRSVIHLGDEPFMELAFGRRRDDALTIRGELLKVLLRGRGSAKGNVTRGEVEAPDAIKSLADRFGAEAAGKLWRFRPQGTSMRWPQTRVSRGNAIVLMGMGPSGIALNRVDVGPFSWLELRQERRGQRQVEIVDVTVVDGEAHLMRAYSTSYGMPSANVIDPFVIESALEALMRSVDANAVGLDDVRALLPRLHLGTVIETEADAEALCGRRTVQQYGRGGGYVTTEDGLANTALSAWRRPDKSGDHITVTTHLPTNAVGSGSEVNGVFSVTISLTRPVVVDVTRVCDGLKPPMMYVG